MSEYTIRRPPGRLLIKAVKPPGNIPSLLKEARIANWLSAPLFSFDGFPQHLLSKSRGCWGKLPMIISNYYDFLQGKIKKSHFNDEVTFPDEIVPCNLRLHHYPNCSIQASGIPHCRSPPLLKSVFLNFRNGG